MHDRTSPGSAREPLATDCVIGLGSNLGDRRRTLEQAVQAVAELGTVKAISSLYESEAVGPPQPRYLNAAVRIRTELGPRAVLEALLATERLHGRERRERWAARTLDLDILWIGGRAVEEPGLSVPHPRLKERAFALLPLLEVAPDAADPRTGEPYRPLVAGFDPGAAWVVDAVGPGSLAAAGGRAGAALDTPRPRWYERARR